MSPTPQTMWSSDNALTVTLAYTFTRDPSSQPEELPAEELPPVELPPVEVPPEEVPPGFTLPELFPAEGPPVPPGVVPVPEFVPADGPWVPPELFPAGPESL